MRRNDVVRRQVETIKEIVTISTIDKDGLTNQLMLHLTNGFNPVIQTIRHPLSEIEADNFTDLNDFKDNLCRINIGDKVELMFNGIDYSVTFLR